MQFLIMRHCHGISGICAEIQVSVRKIRSFFSEYKDRRMKAFSQDFSCSEMIEVAMSEQNTLYFPAIAFNGIINQTCLRTRINYKAGLRMIIDIEICVLGKYPLNLQFFYHSLTNLESFLLL